MQYRCNRRNRKMGIREYPSLMREVIEKMDYMVRVMDEDNRVIYMNKMMRDVFGDGLGTYCYALMGKDNRCRNCVTKKTQQTGLEVMKDVPIKGRYYSVISLPVNTDEGKIYSIELLNDITEQKKMEDELLSHYGKLKDDIEFAKHIQKRTLPLDGIYEDTIKLNSIYLPSEDLGGDIYDLIKMKEDELLLYIADVSGHGITSSLLTIFLRQMVRGRINHSTYLKEIVSLLLESYRDLSLGNEQYLTVLFCLYDKRNKELVFLNAGHNCLPVIVSKDGNVTEVEVKGLPVCNLLANPEYKIVKAPIQVGDRLILFTDGITEAFNDKKVQFGTERLLKLIQDNIELEGNELSEKIIAEVERYSKKKVYDDMAVVISEFLS